MIRILRNVPIRTKLMAIILLVATVVLIIGTLQFLVFGYLTYRDNTLERLSAIGDFVAMNSASAVQHYDQDAALKSLSTLERERSVLTASIVDKSGTTFAWLQSDRVDQSQEMAQLAGHKHEHLAEMLNLEGWSSFKWNHVDVARPIFLDGKRIGTVLITATTEALHQQMREFLYAISFIFAVSIALIFALSTRLQRFLTVPIGRLLEAMSKVSSEEDYRLKVEKRSEDELGQLMDGFNSMLSKIREKDEELRKYGQELEAKVKNRTEDLETANFALELTVRELSRAKEAAETANLAKSTFLASMSHELRTPLNAVIGFSEILIDGHYGPLNEEQKEYIGDILSSGQHLLALISDILDISKIEAGREELDLGAVNIQDLIDASIVMIREKAHQHGIAVNTRIDPGIEGMVVHADHRKLKQIMFNLLSNAAKFTPDGGRIEVGARFCDDELFISVTDTGCGIEEKEVEKIFKEFYQTRGGLVDKTPGTGLGLALARKFVELHGGKIWAESEGPGTGSCFTFSLRTDLLEQYPESRAM